LEPQFEQSEAEHNSPKRQGVEFHSFETNFDATSLENKRSLEKKLKNETKTDFFSREAPKKVLE